MNALDLIAQERKDQIEKHGYDAAHDDMHQDGVLRHAAKFCLDINGTHPEDWDEFAIKVIDKDHIGRLVVAGALVVAEIERLQRIANS